MRILVIEDNPDLATNLCEYLEERGHIVEAAEDGVTGLHLAVRNRYDAILLDVILPGMSGITLCRSLREEAGKDTPVLMLTARDSVEDRINGLDAGADDYVIKPFALREVEARLRALMRRATGRDRARRRQRGRVHGTAAGSGGQHQHGDDHHRRHDRGCDPVRGARLLSGIHQRLRRARVERRMGRRRWARRPAPMDQ